MASEAEVNWQALTAQIEREAEYNPSLKDLIRTAGSAVSDAIDEAEADTDTDPSEIADVIFFLEEAADDLQSALNSLE